MLRIVFLASMRVVPFRERAFYNEHRGMFPNGLLSGSRPTVDQSVRMQRLSTLAARCRDAFRDESADTEPVFLA